MEHLDTFDLTGYVQYLQPIAAERLDYPGYDYTLTCYFDPSHSTVQLHINRLDFMAMNLRNQWFKLDGQAAHRPYHYRDGCLLVVKYQAQNAIYRLAEV